jgi:hypothetical protein
MAHERSAFVVLLAALALASGIFFADRALHFGPPERQGVLCHLSRERWPCKPMC